MIAIFCFCKVTIEITHIVHLAGKLSKVSY